MTINIELSSKEHKDLISYCNLNKLDPDAILKKSYLEGFNIERYGLLGDDSGKIGGIEEKQVEIEVIREIRVEVPVEVIKEVEKIVEVPVEVIKEVPVEKVVIKEVIKEIPVDRVVEKITQTYDDTQVNELLSKIDQLNGEISTKSLEIDNIRQEFSTKTEEMENIFQNKMSKKDEELDELRQKLDILVTNDRSKMLRETLQNLRSELQQKNEQIKELEKINRELLNGNTNQAYLMRGSNLNRRI